MRILFVCLGNICRSPAAEGVFRAQVRQAGMSIEIASAGTGGWHVGALPDKRMCEAALRRGYELNSRAMQLSANHFSAYDIIIAMDESNYRDTIKLARNAGEKAKVRRFADFVSLPQVDHVPDPYYGGTDGFDLVLDIIENGCQSLLDHIRNQA